MSILSHNELLELHHEVIAAGLGESRATLLLGIDAQFVAGLPIADAPADQVLRDLHLLNEAGPLRDGQVPLAILLANFAARSPTHKRSPLLKAAIERCAALSRTAASVPAFRNVQKEHGGAALAERARFPRPPRCFGREQMINDIVEMLLVPEPPPIPVLGPPGIGKSTLCLAAAHHPKVVARFQSRRCFIHCEAHPSPSSLESAIETHLNASVGHGIQRDLAQPLDLLAEPTLLILDNAEVPWETHQGEMEGLLTELCAVPGLVVLCTIRGRERPLGPAWRESVYVGPLLDRDAMELFVAVAGARFREDPLLERILRELGGLPLSVKLFAHNAQWEPSLQELHAKWKKRRTTMLNRGGGQNRDNFATSMELSLNSARMTPEGKRLLSILAFLPDGVDHDDLADLPAGEAVSTLRQVSLVLDESHRTRMLMSLKEYIQDNYPPSEADLDLVTACYLRTGHALRQRCQETQSMQARQRIADEAANLLALAEHSLGPGSPVEGVESALSLIEILLPSRVPVLALLDRVSSRLDNTFGPRIRARCQMCLAEDALRRQLLAPAAAHYQEARRLFAEAGDHRGEAASVWGAGEVAWRRRDETTAGDLYSLSLQLARIADDVERAALSLHRLGDVAAHLEKSNEAARFYEEALLLYQSAGNRVGQAYCHLGLGQMAVASGNHASAEPRFAKATALFQQLRNPVGLAACLGARSEAARKRGDHELFFRLCLESIELLARHTDAVDTQAWKLA